MLKGNLLHSIFDHSVNAYGSVVETIQKFQLVANTITPAPLVVRLRISKRCNLSCTFCYQADSLNKKELNHLSLDEWEKILDQLPKNTIIDITGGETFIAKNFVEVLELILERGFRTSLITNGSYPNEQIISSLVKNKLYFFMISVDGLEKTHNSIRGNKKSFQNICKTIETLESEKKKRSSKFPILCLKVSIAEENYKEIPETISFFKENYGIEDFTLNLLYQNKVRGGNYLHTDFNHPDFRSGNTLSFSPDAIDGAVTAVKKAKEFAANNKISVRIKPEVKTSLLKDYLKNPNSYGVKSCKKHFSVVTMYYDGTISPCDIGLNVTNVKDIDYDLSKTWRELNKTHLPVEIKNGFHPSCEGCCLKDHSAKGK
jgi:MoaA/NifB/PqqE/SkfB family radical SAM enzyme